MRKNNERQDRIPETRLRPLLKEAVVACPEELSRREVNVLALRFGLKDGYERSPEEVGRQFRVSMAEIAEIERRTIEKCLQKPISSLLKQAAQRIFRHLRHNGQEGDEDLKVAKMLLEKTKRLADCLSLVKQA
jgi:DNA-directed RNA polymerase sigma subunit (sigma70/sigma32)